LIVSMVQRLTYRKRLSYRTKGNKVKIVKTPGGKLVYHYVHKTASAPKCGGCGGVIAGVPRIRPRQLSRLNKSRKTVNRTYGGSLCGGCVRDKIVRAFLIEEQKIVKHIVKKQQKKTATTIIRSSSKNRAYGR